MPSNIFFSVMLAMYELMHAFFHWRVLICRAAYPKGDLDKKRFYFVLDALGPLLALTLLPWHTVTIVLIMGHFILHAFYIAYWNTSHPRILSIKAFSSVSHEGERYNQQDFWTNTFGTFYDIVVHVFTASCLIYYSIWTGITQ